VSENKYLQSRLKSIRVAPEGIKHVLITQQNAKIHTAITLAVILFAFLLRINRVELISLLLAIGLVWMAEIYNTAMEVMVDMVSPEHSQGAKVIKDISAGAVFLSAIISVLVGIVVFGPKLLLFVRILSN
jgi:diacylglycerol kinase